MSSAAVLWVLGWVLLGDVVGVHVVGEIVVVEADAALAAGVAGGEGAAVDAIGAIGAAELVVVSVAIGGVADGVAIGAVDSGDALASIAVIGAVLAVVLLALGERNGSWWFGAVGAAEAIAAVGDGR